MMTISYRVHAVMQPSSSPSRSLALLVMPEFSNFGVAAVIESLFIANWLAQQPLFAWHIVSADGEPVRASNRMLLDVDGDLASAAGCKTVFVLASFDPDRAVCRPPVLRWLRRMSQRGVELCGIENGSWTLAAAGLLDGCEVAVHWDNLAGFRERYPAVIATSGRFTRSGARITCAGASAVLDMMVAWMGWHGEGVLAAEVAAHLLLAPARPDDRVQRSAAPDEPMADTVVTQAEMLMRRHVEEPLACADIARRVGRSLRQLERLFKQRAGCTVLQSYRSIRMAEAHQLLQQTDLSVTQVALACGFASPEYFCRLYRGLFHCSPSTDRRQSTDAPVMRQRAGSGVLK